MTPLTISRPPSSAGVVWVKTGWRLFMLAPVPWTGMTALVFLVLMAVSLVPVLGVLAVHVLSPFIVAGYLAASRGGSTGEPISFIYLGAGWREGRNNLLVIGALYMSATLLIFYLVKYFTGGDMEVLLQQTQNPATLTPEQAEQMLATALPAMGLGSLLFAPLLMATWFAPGLVLFEGFPAGNALWWSLWACWVNWRPILLYSLILGVAGMLALMLPFGLGLLIFLPWTLTSTYAAYQDIFSPASKPDGVSELA
ncbi:MAG: BPSS1780 family membrane protein [Pseudomonadota bacterium]|nr:BPSS1780 family membrane protein [Pseudomonadota bacterium]